MTAPSVGLCFVCLGNICRSPTAEGIFLSLVERAGLSTAVRVDSAGTGAWHAGEPPDARALATARARGVALRGTARAFEVEDFRSFDYVVAMDDENRRSLAASAPDSQARGRIHLLRAFDPIHAAAPRDRVPDVPDPYYGGPDGFDEVFDICDAACRGLLAHLRRHHEGLR